jgi:16S rRNA (cytidine1402-2'-O)-methyltransferase
VNKSKGILFIVSTPIGNLKDISLRALDVLNEADLIACEDTRRTLNLIRQYNISKKLISYYEHNKKQRTPQLIKYLKEGKNIALTSDAGTPGISDPGYYIIREVINEGLSVEVIPGASAVLCALIASGKPTDRFIFEGYMPRKKQARLNRLKETAQEKRTVIFYESPYRLMKTLEDINIVMPNKDICLCRELTKKFEEIVCDKAENLIKKYSDKKIRGEFVIVI